MKIFSSRSPVLPFDRPWGALLPSLRPDRAKSVALSLGLAVTGLFSHSAQAVDYTKADNTTTLTTSSSYSTAGGPPTSSADRIIWDTGISAVNAAAGTNTGSLTVGSFVFGTMNGPALINVNSASNNLGVANTTIDMSAAT